jgi:Cyclic phosphodiesterase-like protein
MDVTQHVSYWLVPAAPERDFLQELINTLASAYDAPRFVPHVTLYSGASPANDNPPDIIMQSTQEVHRLNLQVDRILSTEEFTKTVFVQFRPSTLLSQMTEAMRRLSARPSAYRLNPHLSLIYKRLSPPEAQRIAATIRLPMAAVCFDAVWAIASPGTTRTAEDVGLWQVVCRQRLASAP